MSITVTAEAVRGDTRCSACGRASELRKDLFGVDARGVTTSKLDDVDRWVCKGCFTDGVASKPKKGSRR